MNCKLFSAAMALLLLLPGPALAHGSSSNAIVHEEVVKVGPYLVRVGFSDWPLVAQKSAEFTLHPPGGIAGKDGYLLMPKVKHRHHLDRWPGVDDAWVVQMSGFRSPGEQTLQVEVTTGQGTFVGETFTLMVADPPGVPEWLGWAVGLIPLYGIIWFGFRERKRVRLAMAAE